MAALDAALAWARARVIRIDTLAAGGSVRGGSDLPLSDALRPCYMIQLLAHVLPPQPHAASYATSLKHWMQQQQQRQHDEDNVAAVLGVVAGREEGGNVDATGVARNVVAAALPATSLPQPLPPPSAAGGGARHADTHHATAHSAFSLPDPFVPPPPPPHIPGAVPLHASGEGVIDTNGYALDEHSLPILPLLTRLAKGLLGSKADVEMNLERERCLADAYAQAAARFGMQHHATYSPLQLDEHGLDAGEPLDARSLIELHALAVAKAEALQGGDGRVCLPRDGDDAGVRQASATSPTPSLPAHLLATAAGAHPRRGTTDAPDALAAHASAASAVGVAVASISTPSASGSVGALDERLLPPGLVQNLTYFEHAALYAGTLHPLAVSPAGRFRLWAYLLTHDEAIVCPLSTTRLAAASAAKELSEARRAAIAMGDVELELSLLLRASHPRCGTFLARRRLLHGLIRAGLPPQLRGYLWLRFSHLADAVLPYSSTAPSRSYPWHPATPTQLAVIADHLVHEQGGAASMLPAAVDASYWALRCNEQAKLHECAEIGVSDRSSFSSSTAPSVVLDAESCSVASVNVVCPYGDDVYVPSPAVAAHLSNLRYYELLVVMNAEVLQAWGQLPSELEPVVAALRRDVACWRDRRAATPSPTHAHAQRAPPATRKLVTEAEGREAVTRTLLGTVAASVHELEAHMPRTHLLPSSDFRMWWRGRLFAPANQDTVTQINKDMPRTIPHLQPIEPSRVSASPPPTTGMSVRYVYAARGVWSPSPASLTHAASSPTRVTELPAARLSSAAAKLQFSVKGADAILPQHVSTPSAQGASSPAAAAAAAVAPVSPTHSAAPATAAPPISRSLAGSGSGAVLEASSSQAPVSYHVSSSALRRMLLAFSTHSPVLDFVQGLPMIAAHTLRWCGESDAFALFTALLHSVTQPDYYTADTAGITRDQRVLEDLITCNSDLVPLLRHLGKLTGGPCTSVLSLIQSVTLQWFLCLFTVPFSAAFTDRVWDALLCDGDAVLFRVTLALLRAAMPRLMSSTELHVAMSVLKECHTATFSHPTFTAIFDCWLWPVPDSTTLSHAVSHALTLKLAPFVSHDELAHGPKKKRSSLVGRKSYKEVLKHSASSDDFGSLRGAHQPSLSNGSAGDELLTRVASGNSAAAMQQHLRLPGARPHASSGVPRAALPVSVGALRTAAHSPHSSALLRHRSMSFNEQPDARHVDDILHIDLGDLRAEPQLDAPSLPATTNALAPVLPSPAPQPPRARSFSSHGAGRSASLLIPAPLTIDDPSDAAATLVNLAMGLTPDAPTPSLAPHATHVAHTAEHGEGEDVLGLSLLVVSNESHSATPVGSPRSSSIAEGVRSQAGSLEADELLQSFDALTDVRVSPALPDSAPADSAVVPGASSSSQGDLLSVPHPSPASGAEATSQATAQEASSGVLLRAWHHGGGISRQGSAAGFEDQVSVVSTSHARLKPTPQFAAARRYGAGTHVKRASAATQLAAAAGGGTPPPFSRETTARSSPSSDGMGSRSPLPDAGVVGRPKPTQPPVLGAASDAPPELPTLAPLLSSIKRVARASDAAPKRSPTMLDGAAACVNTKNHVVAAAGHGYAQKPSSDGVDAPPPLSSAPLASLRHVNHGLTRGLSMLLASSKVFAASVVHGVDLHMRERHSAGRALRQRLHVGGRAPSHGSVNDFSATLSRAFGEERLHDAHPGAVHASPPAGDATAHARAGSAPLGSTRSAAAALPSLFHDALLTPGSSNGGAGDAVDAGSMPGTTRAAHAARAAYTAMGLAGVQEAVKASKRDGGARRAGQHILAAFSTKARDGRPASPPRKSGEDVREDTPTAFGFGIDASSIQVNKSGGGGSSGSVGGSGGGSGGGDGEAAAAEHGAATMHASLHAPRTTLGRAPGHASAGSRTHALLGVDDAEVSQFMEVDDVPPPSSAQHAASGSTFGADAARFASPSAACTRDAVAADVDTGLLVVGAPPLLSTDVQQLVSSLEAASPGLSSLSRTPPRLNSLQQRSGRSLGSPDVSGGAPVMLSARSVDSDAPGEPSFSLTGSTSPPPPAAVVAVRAGLPSPLMHGRPGMGGEGVGVPDALTILAYALTPLLLLLPAAALRGLTWRESADASAAFISSRRVYHSQQMAVNRRGSSALDGEARGGEGGDEAGSERVPFTASERITLWNASAGSQTRTGGRRARQNSGVAATPTPDAGAVDADIPKHHVLQLSRAPATWEPANTCQRLGSFYYRNPNVGGAAFRPRVWDGYFPVIMPVRISTLPHTALPPARPTPASAAPSIPLPDASSSGMPASPAVGTQLRLGSPLARGGAVGTPVSTPVIGHNRSPGSAAAGGSGALPRSGSSASGHCAPRASSGEASALNLESYCVVMHDAGGRTDSVGGAGGGGLSDISFASSPRVDVRVRLYSSYRAPSHSSSSTASAGMTVSSLQAFLAMGAAAADAPLLPPATTPFVLTDVPSRRSKSRSSSGPSRASDSVVVSTSVESCDLVPHGADSVASRVIPFDATLQPHEVLYCSNARSDDMYMYPGEVVHRRHDACVPPALLHAPIDPLYFMCPPNPRPVVIE